MKRTSVSLIGLTLAVTACGYYQPGDPNFASRSDVDPNSHAQAENPTPARPLSVGETATWINTDLREHSITALDGSFDSGPLMPGARFSRTFTEPGVFEYHCTLHGESGALRVMPATENSMIRFSTYPVPVIGPAPEPSASPLPLLDPSASLDPAPGVSPSPGPTQAPTIRPCPPPQAQQRAPEGC